MDFFNLLEIFQLTCNLLVGLSANPIHSVLYLILTYLFSSISVILNNGNTFIGLIIIIVYIGAVSILFLFSILLLDLRATSLYTSRKVIAITFLFTICIFFYEFSFIFNDCLDFFLLPDSSDIYIDWLSNYQSSHEMAIVALVFYNEYYLILFLAGLALLISLIGSITISLSGATRLRRQITNKQLARQSAAFLRNKLN